MSVRRSLKAHNENTELDKLDGSITELDKFLVHKSKAFCFLKSKAMFWSLELNLYNLEVTYIVQMHASQTRCHLRANQATCTQFMNI